MAQFAAAKSLMVLPCVLASMPGLHPMRGIAYGALPCTEHHCGSAGLPPEDMLQEAYREQWGEPGRDDLGVMSNLGANAVRLYHSLGESDGGHEQDHGGFLDRAQAVGLNVIPGYHTWRCCDCYQAWKDATEKGFRLGFRKGDDWHPAISMLILLNEPDFFGPSCRVRAALSALDGVLAAEREAGVDAGRVKLTVTWSFAMATSIDGKVSGPGIFGFQDMVAGIDNPGIVNYTPRSSIMQLREAFGTRWVHGFNTQSPWKFVKAMVWNAYAQFRPTPWFIGEYGANGQTAQVIQSDLESMQDTATKPGSDFLGAAVFQFQTAEWKGGSERNFGLFRLGTRLIGETGNLCDKRGLGCAPRSVHCLLSDLPFLPGTQGHRAQAVAAAWNGTLAGHGLCDGRRLAQSDKIGAVFV